MQGFGNLLERGKAIFFIVFEQLAYFCTDTVVIQRPQQKALRCGLQVLIDTLCALDYRVVEKLSTEGKTQARLVKPAGGGKDMPVLCLMGWRRVIKINLLEGDIFTDQPSGYMVPAGKYELG